MPRPAYIIFANSGAVDQYSNAVSMFDVVETLAQGQQPQRIVAVWLREEGDSPADMFQGQVVCLAPDGSELFVGECEDFAFTEPFYRWNSDLELPGFTQLGVHLIEARLRSAGDQDWTWRQQFSFLVQTQGLTGQEVNAPRVPQTTGQGLRVAEKTHDSIDEPAMPNNRDIESLGAALWDESSPVKRKFLRTMVREAMTFMGRFYGEDTGTGEFDPDRDPEKSEEVLGRLAAQLDAMEYDFAGPSELTLKITLSQAVSLLLELGFENAKEWGESGDAKTVQEKINSLAEVIGVVDIKKIKDIDLLTLLGEILKKIKANDEFVQEVKATLQIEVRAD